jgi:cell wall-associated NlpC family hydrolase
MTRRLPARLYADLIGKSYRADGRGPEAYDCLGLVLELQRRQGRDVPQYSSTSEELHRSVDRGAGILGVARSIGHPQPGCVVLLRTLEPGRVHMGTMLDPWSMVHCSESSQAVVVERLAGSRWERCVLGFYVPEGGAA